MNFYNIAWILEGCMEKMEGMGLLCGLQRCSEQ